MDERVRGNAIFSCGWRTRTPKSDFSCEDAYVARTQKLKTKKISEKTETLTLAAAVVVAVVLVVAIAVVGSAAPMTPLRQMRRC